ncbi:Uncharacterised protein [Buttiauxella agrestis]|uniref:Uncharacterized protein n=1 Tax=Buttiauxella agrestis TaxID=82977 RepID=A0A381KNB7_9ENTR|nr:hypothetical protein [Buttiauxella agrestis]SUY92864.1 Uncharacterised protein [Buttiauxella agrestis]
MSHPEAIPNDVTPFHMTEEQQCQAIRDRIHMVVNGYRNTVPPTHITRKKYRIRFLPVSLIAACLAVGFSEREIINVHLYFLIAVPVLGYYVFKQVQSGDGFIHVTPGEKFWRNDIISDADILLLSENVHIRDWLNRTLNETHRLTYTLLAEKGYRIEWLVRDERIIYEKKRIRQVINNA